MTVSRRPLVVAGSVGLRFGFGAFSLRPRVDAIYSRPLTIDFAVDLPFPAPDTASLGFAEELRPFVIMVGLDIGFGVG